MHVFVHYGQSLRALRRTFHRSQVKNEGHSRRHGGHGRMETKRSPGFVQPLQHLLLQPLQPQDILVKRQKIYASSEAAYVE